MAEATLKSMIEQMEARAQALYVKMEGFRDIQTELHTLTKAIKVMKGEKLTPGNPGLSNGHKSKQQRLAESLPDMDVTGSSNIKGIRDVVYKILKSHPKGIKVHDIERELTSQGFSITRHTVHNAMRGSQFSFKSVGSRGSGQKLYTLA